MPKIWKKDGKDCIASKNKTPRIIWEEIYKHEEKIMREIRDNKLME